MAVLKLSPTFVCASPRNEDRLSMLFITASPVPRTCSKTLVNKSLNISETNRSDERGALKYRRRGCKQVGEDREGHSRVTMREKPIRELGAGLGSQWDGKRQTAGREGVQKRLSSGRRANPAALASANPPGSAVLRGWGRPSHQDLGEDVPGVLAFSLQPQRAERLLQPRRRARPRGLLRAS